jgi:hypothetical protein
MKGIWKMDRLPDHIVQYPRRQSSSERHDDVSAFLYGWLLDARY